mgnify:CR=1 FL=1
METWDLYTAEGQRTGMTMTRGEKVPEGYFHMVCDVLIRHTDGDYLLMLRSREKKVYPGRWESTCGGSAAGMIPHRSFHHSRRQTGCRACRRWFAAWCFICSFPV